MVVQITHFYKKEQFFFFGLQKLDCMLYSHIYIYILLSKKIQLGIEPSITCFQLTTLTTRALMFLITCDCFNVMYSTQILGPISFNLTIPKSFLTIMQLNLITITPPFLADLINFYEKKGLQGIESGST
jgi:hypothetical protein